MPEELAQSIILEGGKILLVKRKGLPVWEIPSGHIEKGETAREAAKRETLEETGYIVSIEYLIGTYKNSFFGKNIIRKLYLCRIKGGGATLNNEVSRICFFPIDKLPRSLVFWYHRPIRDAVSRKRKVLVQEQFSLAAYFLFVLANPGLLLRPYHLLRTVL